jgi:hypothetical protein
MESLGRLEFLGEAVAAAPRYQQEDVDQRVKIPTGGFPPLRGISHLLENACCEKLSHRADQRLGPPPLAGPLPCVGHLPFLHDGAWCCKTPSSPERLFHARSTNHRFPEAHCHANIRDGKNLGSM